MTASCVRIGTPALTSRGMGAREMTFIAALIGRVLDSSADEKVLAKVRGEVRDLCKQFPMYVDRQ
jgi:glycine hydroxymethyltransferase